MQNVFKMFEPCVSVLLARLGGHSVRVAEIVLAFFWLALRTLTFGVSIWTIIRGLKCFTFRRGSEVSQVLRASG